MWPILFLVVRPLWNLLPEETRVRIVGFWNERCYPWIEPVLDMLPNKVRGLLFYGMPSSTQKKPASSGDQSCCSGGSCPMASTSSSAAKNNITASTPAPVDAGSSTTSASSGDESQDRQTLTKQQQAALERLLLNFGKGVVATPASDDDFELLRDYCVKTNKKKVLFVDFTASWCAPCKKLKPVFEELAGTYKDTSVFCLVDVDELGDTASDHGVTTLPAFGRYDMEGKFVKMPGMPTEQNLRDFVRTGVSL
eukprot:CAMPEP_0178992468 /NCGR_PEP_ID=MMETSP0795-20121207/6130_1 /TAXON_ID=88552 /ORGANISM="Amoebophrya sp., Strain Ameob2" /LENGTH=251 /DNA_ID=CAMNT_0020684351 /DNA_START=290 /DNA_END=1045 /DNA_ORIENTATION=-